MNLKKGVILASGGLDSTTLCYLFIKEKIEFIPLIINYGQHCFETELDRLKNVLPPQYVDKIEIIDISEVYKYSTSKFIQPVNLWEEL
jgi:7-cyano-7-deazaguanine synthase